MAEVMLFNVIGDRFSVTLGLVRLVVVIYIVRAKPIEGHVWSPVVVPDVLVKRKWDHRKYPFISFK